jgi:hypothetical protein
MVMQVLENHVSGGKGVKDAMCLRPSAKMPRHRPLLVPGGSLLLYFVYPMGSQQCKSGSRYSCTSR